MGSTHSNYGLILEKGLQDKDDDDDEQLICGHELIFCFVSQWNKLLGIDADNSIWWLI